MNGMFSSFMNNPQRYNQILQIMAQMYGGRLPPMFLQSRQNLPASFQAPQQQQQMPMQPVAAQQMSPFTGQRGFGGFGGMMGGMFRR